MSVAVAAIDTPALVVDLDAMARNLAAMAAFARDHGLRLRPHAKTHKSGWIAQRQLEHGAVGVCVQKTAEGEALADAGVGDIFITNEVVDPAKLARVAALARRVRLALAVDSLEGVERLAQALRDAPAPLDVFVEIDVGHGRCGAPPARAGELAARVRAHAGTGLHFAGLQAYHGQAQHLRGAAERRAAIDAASKAVRAAQAALAHESIGCPLVTGAGSGSFALEAASGLWGELQCGSYVFMDRDYADNEEAPRFEHALFVKSQVMSRHADRAVIDAGHKSHAIDRGLPVVWQRPDLGVHNGGDEHMVLRPCTPGAVLPALGETVWLVPGHCDPTVNLHDTLVGVRGGLLHGTIERTIRVDARGALG